MKGLFQLFIFFLPLSTIGQRITTGTYLFPEKKSFITEILTIGNNGTFKYFYYDCQYVKLGEGDIEEKRDSIILRFHKLNGVTYQTFDSKTEKGDSISIKIKAIFKEDSSLLTNGFIALKALGIGTAFNSNGEAEFKSARPKTSDTLEISQIGFIPVKIPISPSYSSISGTAWLSNIFFFNQGDIIKYKLENGRTIQAHPGGYFFVKISKSRARSIIKKWGQTNLNLTI